MAWDDDDIGTEGKEHGTGIRERMAGGLRRTAGAITRAARGAMGRPEASDPLFRTLHADHDDVSQLFEKMKAAEGDDATVKEVWTKLCVNLLTHARSEQEVVYADLEGYEETEDQTEHAKKEHADIERLLMECDAQGVGSEEFFAMVEDFELVVRHHVDDEEGKLLPQAQEALSDDELQQLCDDFEARKLEMKPKIQEWLSGGGKVPDPSAEDDGAYRGKADQRAVSARPTSESRRNRKGGTDWDGKTVRELRTMASQRQIEGRSRMNRAELVRALSRQGARGRA